MALDDRYILQEGLEQYFVDKVTGLPLTDGFIYFYEDNSRTTAKPVFQLTGTPANYSYVELPNPIELSAVGTPQNGGGDNIAIYYYPFDADGNLQLYYIVVTDSDGVVQFTREAWPNTTSGSDPSETPSSINNVITNAQFSTTFLNDTATVITVSGAAIEVPIAPDWILQANGTGTITLSQVALTGQSNIPTSPAFALDVTVSSGITTCNLVQRFYHNSGLWGSTSDSLTYLTASFVAKRESISATGLVIYYKESNGNVAQTLGTANLTDTYQRFNFEPVEIAESAATSDSETAYVDIYMSINQSVQIQITSVQVALTTNGNTLPYDERSSNRDKAYMGDFYIPALSYRQAPSMLTGWDFPLNPAQVFTASAPTVNATPKYIWDQTIIATSSSTITVAANTQTFALQCTTSATNQAFYVMQYLSGFQAKKILSTPLSVNVFASKTAAGNDVNCRIYLFRGSSAAVFPTLPAVIGAITSDGVFTKNNTAGQGLDWTEIPRSNLPTAYGTLSVADTTAALNDVTDLGFNGWEVTDATEASDTDKFCIVVTFQCPSLGTVVNINSISLVPGDIPCRPAPQTQDEVLRECQYYFEKSYKTDVAPGTVTGLGALTFTQTYSGSNERQGFLAQSGFSISYKTIKRTAASVTLYSPNVATADRIRVNVLGKSDVPATASNANNYTWSLAWTETGLSESGVQYDPILAALGSGIVGIDAGIGQVWIDLSAYIKLHYTADARLGIV